MSRWARVKMQGAGALAAALFGAVVVASSAFAFVTVYSNSFDSKREYKEVVRVGGNGNACKRGWIENREIMRVKLSKAPGACTYKPPVQGDGPQPDHRFDLDARVLKDTAKAVREDAYVSAAVRVGGGHRYELRDLPQAAPLRAAPPAGRGRVPRPTATSPTIKKLGGLNKLRLQAEGNRIRAFVNGTQVADVTDANAGPAHRGEARADRRQRGRLEQGHGRRLRQDQALGPGPLGASR